MTRSDEAADVLVVGGGPAGASAAVHLARAGHHVTLVEHSPTPADVGAAVLTPRAVTALGRLAPGPARAATQLPVGFHRVEQVRFTAGDHSTSTPWPDATTAVGHGGVVARDALDVLLLDAARAAGARVLTGHDATAPIVERGFVRGARVAPTGGPGFEVRARYTLVADGANSPFGRALGTFRQPTWPYALAHRARYHSALHDATEIELVVDLRDRAGTPLTGFGWLAPRGDGTVDVGVLLHSTSPAFHVINPVHLLDRFAADRTAPWYLGDRALGASGGRIPLGLSVGPAAGPTYLAVGDAVGAANPMSGAGIEYALETGALATEVLDEALRTGSATSLQRYPRLLADRYGAYFRTGRLADRVLGYPTTSRWVADRVARHRPVADAVLRLAANQLRPGRLGFAEAVYRIARATSVVAPQP